MKSTMKVLQKVASIDFVNTYEKELVEGKIKDKLQSCNFSSIGVN
jgi:hypothetical protein